MKPRDRPPAGSPIAEMVAQEQKTNSPNFSIITEEFDACQLPVRWDKVGPCFTPTTARAIVSVHATPLLPDPVVSRSFRERFRADIAGVFREFAQPKENWTSSASPSTITPAEGTGADPLKLHIALDHTLYNGSRSDSLISTANSINSQFAGSFCRPVRPGVQRYY